MKINQNEGKHFNVYYFINNFLGKHFLGIIITFINRVKRLKFIHSSQLNTLQSNHLNE